MSRGTWDGDRSRTIVIYGAVTRSGRTFQSSSTNHTVSYSVLESPLKLSVPRPPYGNAGELCSPYRFGLSPVRSPLLGRSRLFSLPRGTKMFQFPRLPPRGGRSLRRGHTASPVWGCPIRESSDRSLLAAPRGVSSCATPFIGSLPQGIRLLPLVA